VKYKKLVGGGMLKIVNKTVPEALTRLGYSDAQTKEMVDHIHEKDTIEGAPHLKEEHLAVFDCAFRPSNGQRFIHYMGHIRMMAAVQPFLSGAISKTVNMPTDATIEDIENAYFQSWRLGLKAIAIYRDGCKRIQPLNLSKDIEPHSQDAEGIGPPQAVRHKLSDERQSLTHKFSVGGHEGYLTVGLYKDGRPGEIFVVMAKQGSTISGLMDSFATAISLALQHGVPLDVLVDKFKYTRFEPAGFSQHPDIGYASSVMDYIFRWLKLRFIDTRLGVAEKDKNQMTHNPVEVVDASTISSAMETQDEGFIRETDAPACHECGAIMVRSGACHKCLNCGATSGCS
jgi:ribonucleoside-diphosphate reductase alpha chain